MKIHNITTYPLCEILYKKDNSAGWYYGCMGGEEKECKKRCEQLKEKFGWYDYKCRIASHWAKKPSAEFQPHNPYYPAQMHQTSDLIYYPQEKKWYMPDEIMPYPKNSTDIDDNFEITITGEGENIDVSAPIDEDDFKEKTEVLILFGSTKYENYVLADYMLDDIKPFIKRLKKDHFSNLSVLEYTNTKLLAWKKDNNIRLIIQNYYSDVTTECDKLIPEDIFYKEFTKLYEKLKYYIDRRKEMYKDFKKQEKFLNSLKWVYDKQKTDVPCEYTLFEWNKNKNKDLQIFAKDIQIKLKTNIYSGIPYAYFETGEYGYWLATKENCIYRTYPFFFKIKSIERFIKSNDFEYKKNMSLSDVYTQLLDKGYNWAFDCEFNGKRFDVYANGRTYGQEEGKEYLKEECEEIEKRIKEIYKKYPDKTKFNIDKLCEELRKDKNIRHCSSRIGVIMKIKV